MDCAAGISCAGGGYRFSIPLGAEQPADGGPANANAGRAVFAVTAAVFDAAVAEPEELLAG